MKHNEEQIKELETKLNSLHRKLMNEFESLDYYKRRSLIEEIHKTKKEIDKLKGK